MDKKKMPSEQLTFIQELEKYGVLGYIWIIIFSIWAGVSKYAGNLIKSGERPTVRGVILHTIAPAFVGLVTNFICSYFSLEADITSALVGVAAYNGVRSLDFFSEIIEKKLTSTSKNRKNSDE